MCEIGDGFSFAALWVFRLRRAEAASAVWIPHWHSEPFESAGTRAAKRYVSGNLVERERGEEGGSARGGAGVPPAEGVVARWGAMRRGLPRRWSLNLNSAVRLRSRLYGFHTGTRSLSNRKGRGRRSGT